MATSKNLKRRSIIGVTAILLTALAGLLFVNTDYVAADKTVPQTVQSLSESSPDADNSSLGASVSVLPSFIRIISAMVVVIVCIYVFIFLLKRFLGRRYQGSRNVGNLEVLEAIHIAPGKSVTLLRIGEKSVLLGATENSLSLLSSQDASETEKLLAGGETENNTQGFGEFLKSAVDRVKDVADKGKRLALETRSPTKVS